MKKNINVSIIIPVRVVTDYLKETISNLKMQSEKTFEIIVVSDKKEKIEGARVISSNVPTPSYKRNLGAKYSLGEILAFLDDDSYPCKNWLKAALEVFSTDKKKIFYRVVATCGPTLTPESDNIYQKASGWVWATFFGSGGAGTYRNKIMTRREVDDFPSVNLLVRKEDFKSVGGFDVRHWPGEDTKLCLDLKKTGGKIIYDPKIVVYHHRRKIIVPHLQQILRYARRRGYFARNYPETSMRLGYLFPSFFAYGLIFGSLVSFFSRPINSLFISLIFIYLIILLVTGLEVFIKEKNFYLSLLVIVSIYFTHFAYGLIFPFGYFQKTIKTIPHKVDIFTKRYIGG